MISYGKHLIDQKDIDLVVKVLKSDWLTCGPMVKRFEEELAKITAAKHVISCSNGTTALHLAMLALGITTKDTVLVPAITFLASANSVRYVGADVAFVDIDPTTGLMTAKTLEAAILANKNKNLKAVINVHFAGQCENLENIYRIAKKYNLYIIEDAAHAIGTVYIDKNGKKHPIGKNTFSDLTTFSFHPVKTIATGEGGAITTNDRKIAEKLRLCRHHGMIRDATKWKETANTGPWYYEMQELGYNYRISDINCALGVSQLQKLPRFIAKRTAIVDFYDRAFKKWPHIIPLKKLKHSKTAWHLYIVNLDLNKIGKTRNQIIQLLHDFGVTPQIHYIPLYRHPYYKNYAGEIRLPGAELYFKQCLTLPLYVSLKKSEQQKIINLLSKIC